MIILFKFDFLIQQMPSKNQKLPFEFDPELTRCPLCFSHKISWHKKDFKDIDIWKCANCNVQFMNPQYSDAYLTHFYNLYQAGEKQHHKYKDASVPRKRLHEYNLTEIELYVDKGRFLSVGSGNGFDLEVALERGWEVEGFDLDEAFNKQLSDKLKIPVRSGIFMNIPYEKNYFDCVYLNHVLEHPKNPGEYLEKIKSILKPGGILYLACPNIDSISNRIKTGMEKLGLRNKKAKHYDTWQHLFYYNPMLLKKTLENQYEFTVVKVENDVAITDALKIQKGLVSYPYKSSFRLLAQK